MGEILRKELIILLVLLGVFLASGCAGNKNEALNNTVTPNKEVTPISMDNRAGMMGNRTGMMDNRTEIIENRTGMMDNRTGMVDNRTGMMGNRTGMIDNRTGMMGKTI